MTSDDLSTSLFAGQYYPCFPLTTGPFHLHHGTQGLPLCQEDNSDNKWTGTLKAAIESLPKEGTHTAMLEMMN